MKNRLTNIAGRLNALAESSTTEFDNLTRDILQWENISEAFENSTTPQVDVIPDPIPIEIDKPQAPSIIIPNLNATVPRISYENGKLSALDGLNWLYGLEYEPWMQISKQKLLALTDMIVLLPQYSQETLAKIFALDTVLDVIILYDRFSIAQKVFKYPNEITVDDYHVQSINQSDPDAILNQLRQSTWLSAFAKISGTQNVGIVNYNVNSVISNKDKFVLTFNTTYSIKHYALERNFTFSQYGITDDRGQASDVISSYLHLEPTLYEKNTKKRLLFHHFAVLVDEVIKNDVIIRKPTGITVEEYVFVSKVLKSNEARYIVLNEIVYEIIDKTLDDKVSLKQVYPRTDNPRVMISINYANLKIYDIKVYDKEGKIFKYFNRIVEKGITAFQTHLLEPILEEKTIDVAIFQFEHLNHRELVMVNDSVSDLYKLDTIEQYFKGIERQSIDNGKSHLIIVPGTENPYYSRNEKRIYHELKLSHLMLRNFMISKIKSENDTAKNQLRLIHLHNDSLINVKVEDKKRDDEKVILAVATIITECFNILNDWSWENAYQWSDLSLENVDYTFLYNGTQNFMTGWPDENVVFNDLYTLQKEIASAPPEFLILNKPIYSDAWLNLAESMFWRKNYYAEDVILRDKRQLLQNLRLFNENVAILKLEKGYESQYIPVHAIYRHPRHWMHVMYQFLEKRILKKWPKQTNHAELLKLNEIMTSWTLFGRNVSHDNVSEWYIDEIEYSKVWERLNTSMRLPDEVQRMQKQWEKSIKARENVKRLSHALSLHYLETVRKIIPNQTLTLLRSFEKEMSLETPMPFTKRSVFSLVSALHYVFQLKITSIIKFFETLNEEYNNMSLSQNTTTKLYNYHRNALEQSQQYHNTNVESFLKRMIENYPKDLSLLKPLLEKPFISFHLKELPRNMIIDGFKAYYKQETLAGNFVEQFFKAMTQRRIKECDSIEGYLDSVAEALEKKLYISSKKVNIIPRRRLPNITVTPYRDPVTLKFVGWVNLREGKWSCAPDSSQMAYYFCLVQSRFNYLLLEPWKNDFSGLTYFGTIINALRYYHVNGPSTDVNRAFVASLKKEHGDKILFKESGFCDLSDVVLDAETDEEEMTTIIVHRKERTSRIGLIVLRDGKTVSQATHTKIGSFESIDYPEILTIKKIGNEDISPLNQQNLSIHGKAEYKLTAVTLYNGSHYYAWIRYEDDWYTYDDLEGNNVSFFKNSTEKKNNYKVNHMFYVRITRESKEAMEPITDDGIFNIYKELSEKGILFTNETFSKFYATEKERVEYWAGVYPLDVKETLSRLIRLNWESILVLNKVLPENIGNVLHHLYWSQDAFYNVAKLYSELDVTSLRMMFYRYLLEHRGEYDNKKEMLAERFHAYFIHWIRNEKSETIIEKGFYEQWIPVTDRVVSEYEHGKQILLLDMDETLIHTVQSFIKVYETQQTLEMEKKGQDEKVNSIASSKGLSIFNMFYTEQDSGLTVSVYAYVRPELAIFFETIKKNIKGVEIGIVTAARGYDYVLNVVNSLNATFGEGTINSEYVFFGDSDKVIDKFINFDVWDHVYMVDDRPEAVRLADSQNKDKFTSIPIKAFTGEKDNSLQEVLHNILKKHWAFVDDRRKNLQVIEDKEDQNVTSDLNPNALEYIYSEIKRMESDAVDDTWLKDNEETLFTWKSLYDSFSLSRDFNDWIKSMPTNFLKSLSTQSEDAQLSTLKHLWWLFNINVNTQFKSIYAFGAYLIANKLPLYLDMMGKFDNFTVLRFVSLHKQWQHEVEREKSIGIDWTSTILLRLTSSIQSIYGKKYQIDSEVSAKILSSINNEDSIMYQKYISTITNAGDMTLLQNLQRAFEEFLTKWVDKVSTLNVSDSEKETLLFSKVGRQSLLKQAEAIPVNYKENYPELYNTFTTKVITNTEFVKMTESWELVTRQWSITNHVRVIEEFNDWVSSVQENSNEQWTNLLENQSDTSILIQMGAKKYLMKAVLRYNSEHIIDAFDQGFFI